MPIMKVKGGYKYGPTGKVYPTREQAAKQGRAIEANRKPRKKRKWDWDSLLEAYKGGKL